MPASGVDQVGRPESTAAVTLVRAFMQYPHPVVLANLEGTTLLSNAAWSERFGAGGVEPESVRIQLR